MITLFMYTPTAALDVPDEENNVNLITTMSPLRLLKTVDLISCFHKILHASFPFLFVVFFDLVYTKQNIESQFKLCIQLPRLQKERKEKSTWIVFP